MPTVPSKESETGPFRRVWIKYNKLVEYVESLKVLESPEIKVHHTTRGQFVKPKVKAATSQRVQYRGEFSKGFGYSSGDLVRVSAGPEAGTYIAIQDVPINANNDPKYLPWTGFGYWVLLSRLTDQSQWV